MQGISSYNDRSNGKKSERGEGGVVSSHQDGGVTPDNFHVLVPPVFGPEGDHAARGIAVGSGAAGFRREEGAHLCLILLRSLAVAVRLVLSSSSSVSLALCLWYQAISAAGVALRTRPLLLHFAPRVIRVGSLLRVGFYMSFMDMKVTSTKKKDMKVTFLTCFFFLKRKKKCADHRILHKKTYLMI
jgi:hypothetical protein